MPAAAKEHLDRIDDAGERAKELIQHLLAYARPTRHNPHPTDLNAVIRDAQQLVAASVGREHPVELTLARRLPAVMVDRGRVEQIIINLCMNAKQATPDGGSIVIATGVETLSQRRAGRCTPPVNMPGRYVAMRVTDSGAGVGADLLACIFDPFFTTRTEGHGLGLAVVQGILRQHGGGALVESKVGRGTTFHIYLPIAKDAGKRAGKNEPRGAVRTTSKNRGRP